MQATLVTAVRQFVTEQHLRSILEGEWTSLFDADGKLLPGIRGRIGVSATKVDGTDIGVDFMEMQPGSEFPLHIHEGDHVLYFMTGAGIVHINGVDHRVKEGDIIFIPAEYPHGVKVGKDEVSSLTFLAFGHPHSHLDAKDRMRHPHEH